MINYITAVRRKINNKGLAFNILISLGTIFLLSLISFLLLEFMQNPGNIWATVNWSFSNVKLYLLSSLMIFIIYVFFISLTGNVKLGAFLTLIIFEFLSYANYEKLCALGEPLYPSDLYKLRYFQTVTDSIKEHLALKMILALLVMTLILGYFIRKLPKLSINIITRISLVVGCSFLMYSYANFNTSFIKKVSSGSGLNISLWDQPVNYDINGFVFGMLSNLQTKTMDKPKDYNKEKVLQIAEKYKKQADEINKERTKGNSVKPNIVFLMNESFWDPTRLTPLKFSADPMQNIRNIMSKNSSGWLLSPVFGGGTANVEFEALTGFSNYSLLDGSIPYQQSMENEKSIPSVATMLEQKGYDTLAIHPNSGVLYKRDRAYDTLGFNKFIDYNDMKYKNKLGNSDLVSDQSVVNEILDNLKGNSNPMFIHAVTIQNHLPLPANEYKQDEITVDGLNKDSTSELQTYAEGIKQSDTAVKNLIDSIAKLNKPTIVVFWGDHLPAFADPIYSEAKYAQGDPEENERLLSETPLFIYSNFNLGKEDLKTLSPSYLGVTISDMLNQPLSPYYALLEDLKSKLPGLKKDLLIDTKGNIVPQADNGEKELLEDYKLIQYDLMCGNQYSKSIMFGQ